MIEEKVRLLSYDIVVYKDKNGWLNCIIENRNYRINLAKILYDRTV
jgi:hypothetical protein